MFMRHLLQKMIQQKYEFYMIPKITIYGEVRNLDMHGIHCMNIQ
jgi:hypothetical protein